MTDRTPFEARLEDRLLAHAAHADRSFDAAAIAASVAVNARQRTWGWQAPWQSSGRGFTPLVAALLLLGLLIALMGVLLLPGSPPKLPAIVEPTASASPAPVGVAVPVGPIAPPPEFPSTSSEPVPGHGVMTRAADMTEGRIEPVMVTLTDGRVLIVGGMSDASAEIFDPSTGKFTATKPGSTTGDGSGVLLKDGRVLVVLYDSNYLAASICVFDPQSMTWSRVAAKGFEGTELDGSGQIRRYPTLTLLRDGRVLLSGGEVNSPGGGAGTVVDTAEIFDPDTETLSQAGSMVRPRVGHSATTLLDGRVLIAGGRGPCLARNSLRGCDSQPDLQDAEIFDPATGTFTPTGEMSGIQGPTEGLLLPDGRVLVLSMSVLPPPHGDTVGTDGPGLVETYDPASGTFTVAAPTPHRARTATLLPDGRVFLTAQWDLPANPDGSVPFTTWSGVYNPTTGVTQDAPAPPAGWQQPALLADGRVLLAGGVLNGTTPDGGIQVPPWMELYEWP